MSNFMEHLQDEYDAITDPTDKQLSDMEDAMHQYMSKLSERFYEHQASDVPSESTFDVNGEFDEDEKPEHLKTEATFTVELMSRHSEATDEISGSVELWLNQDHDFWVVFEGEKFEYDERRAQFLQTQSPAASLTDQIAAYVKNELDA